MSTRFSPDGMYWWDGSRWVSTLSPDARSRWDGRQWVLVEGAAYAPVFEQRPPSRRPTPWTRPLQYAIVAYYVLAGVYTVTLPFTMSGVVGHAVTQSLEEQQGLYPQASPPPADFTQAMTSMMTFMLGFAAVFGFAICVVGIIAALKRWTWAYYVILVLFGLGILSVIGDALELIAVATLPNPYAGLSLPAWLYIIGLGAGLINVGLFVWMLVALVRYGPWAMKRVEA